MVTLKKAACYNIEFNKYYNSILFKVSEHGTIWRQTVQKANLPVLFSNQAYYTCFIDVHSER